MLLFDIKNFYPSTKEIRKKIRFAECYISITNKDIEAIFHARKSLLYYNDEPSVKKGENNFDVTVGVYHETETSELTGTFTLSLLSKHINKNRIGLCRDYGLAIFKNASGLKAEKLKKKFQKIFKEKKNDVIVQYNSKITNCLDTTLSLSYGSYHPYRKPNEETKYIQINSGHSPLIIK